MATAEVPEDDEAWLYGEAEKKDGSEKPDEGATEGEEYPDTSMETDAAPIVAESKLSAEAAPFVPESKDDIPAEDKEAGEVSGEDIENQDEDDDSDDDDVQVVIGDIKTQPTYEKFKSTYTRTTQQSVLAKQTGKGVDLDAPGTINGVSVYEYDLTSLDVDEKPWRKPGADITDYFNYGFNEDTWMKYCEKQKRLRTENGVSARMFIHHNPLPSSSRTTTSEKPDPSVQSPNYRAGASTTTPTTQTNLASPTDRRAGPPPCRKMSGAIDVIGGTQRDSRRPKNQFEFDSQPSAEVPEYKKYMPVSGPGPSDLPPSHIPPPGYHGPPPPLQPPGPVPPPHMVGPPMGVAPPPGPPRFGSGDPYANAYYPPPSGPPPDRGPPGYDGRGNYGYDSYAGPPPGYHGPPPTQPGNWDNRGTGAPYNDWDYRRDRSPPRSESEFSSSGEDYGERRFRGRELYDPFERDSNYSHPNRHDRPRSRDRMDRSMDRGPERLDRGPDRREDRDRRHRERSDRPDRPERPERTDREKDDRHRRRKEGPEGEHRSKHKKSKRSKRDREEEPMETAAAPAEAAAPPVAT